MSAGATHAERGSDRPRFDMSSLIDIGFLLLVYFLATSTLEPREADLSLTMGGAGCGVAVDFDRPRIHVDAGGVVHFAGEAVASAEAGRDLPDLRDRLATYRDAWAAADQEGVPAVELSVHDSVSGQRFIDVVNCLAEVEIAQLLLVDGSRP